jgi:hypothetical protein
MCGSRSTISFALVQLVKQDVQNKAVGLQKHLSVLGRLHYRQIGLRYRGGGGPHEYIERILYFDITR